MNKKNYIVPQMEVYIMDVKNIMAMSSEFTQMEKNDNAIMDENDILTKQRSFLGDEGASFGNLW